MAKTPTTNELLMAQLRNELLGEFASLKDDINQSTAPTNNTNQQSTSKTPAQLQLEQNQNKKRLDNYKNLNNLFTQLSSSLKKNNVELLKFYKYIKENAITLEQLPALIQSQNTSLDEFLQKLNTSFEQTKVEKTSIIDDSSKITTIVSKVIGDKLKILKTPTIDKNEKIEKTSSNEPPAELDINLDKMPEESPKSKNLGMQKRILDASIETNEILLNISKLTSTSNNVKKEKEKKEEAPKKKNMLEVLFGENKLTSLPGNITKATKFLQDNLKKKEPEEQKKEKPEEKLPENEINAIDNTIQQQILDANIETNNILSNSDKFAGNKNVEKPQIQPPIIENKEETKLELPKQEINVKVDTKPTVSPTDEGAAAKADVETEFKIDILNRVEDILATLKGNKGKGGEEKGEKGKSKSLKETYESLKDFFKNFKAGFSYAFKFLGKHMGTIIKALPRLFNFVRPFMSVLSRFALPLAAITGAITTIVAVKKFFEMKEAAADEAKSEIDVANQSRQGAKTFMEMAKDQGVAKERLAEIMKINDDVARENAARLEVTKAYLGKLKAKGVSEEKLQELKNIKDAKKQLLMTKKLFDSTSKEVEATKIPEQSKPEIAPIEVQPEVKMDVQPVQDKLDMELEGTQSQDKLEMQRMPENTNKAQESISEQTQIQTNTNDQTSKLIELQQKNNVENAQNMRQLIEITKNNKPVRQNMTYVIPPPTNPSLMIPILQH
jgi:hypothetical protein